VAVATAETPDRLGLDNLTDIAKATPGLVFDETRGRDGDCSPIRGQADILGQRHLLRCHPQQVAWS
jgi:hypothetical protein